MSKLARHGGPRGFDFDTAWCKSSDVEKLEAEHAQLLEAAEEMVRITDGQVIYSFMAKQRDRLRAAIARAKGEVKP